MASWLKAAEDLFEVVDRKAKLAVGEKPDELPVPTKGSNGRGSQAKRARARAKKKLLSNEAPSAVDNEKEQTIPETSQSPAQLDGNIPSALIENSETNPGVPTNRVDSDEQYKADNDGSITETSVLGTISNNEVTPGGGHVDTEKSTDVEATASNMNGESRMEEFGDNPVGNPSNAPIDAHVVNGDPSSDLNQNLISEDAGTLKNIELSGSQTLHEETPIKADTQSKDVDLINETDVKNKEHQEQETVKSAVKVQEQLEEAQGLLKSAMSTGQSKEARLARVCAGLSSRLQEYKSENAQLEELLTAERELTKSYEAHIQQLQKDLSSSKGEVNRVEANMVEALSAKNAEIETLVSSVDALKKQSALAEGNLASLQASMESIMRNRELTETRMMQALREELAAAERRAEEEHFAHNATKMAAREREGELEQRAIEASAALVKTQRAADDRASKAAELEQKVALLEVECASLNQELQDMEARVRRGQKKAPEDANQAIQVQAWQEEVERARQSQREAESKLSSMEAEVQKMRVEMAAIKRDAEHYSRQEHMELEKRYRELTDLLYYKQTQLETMASEKAAAEFQLEKEVKRLQEAQLEAERNRVSRRASSSWEEDADMKTLEPLPLHHRQMAGASLQLQLQRAAKLLDTGAARATRFLWRYPTARIILLFYLVFVHLFLMYLLHRLQEQADNNTPNEVEESMRLFNRTSR
ncbi:LOW QUALITY PROTEIN: golgin candidate 1-like [Salvia miltiorrhiza]|uniref:LOW QUALITY PROTEIN: golgin candidate 1-like n=1 Tax=Salvia miltiorrhiza TaxID=226208 RepID=UPI0025AC35CA|nr:LOW QUALITY PROTEIN: golgin candidate 1-like [Salvia miltiorrhiza]